MIGVYWPSDGRPASEEETTHGYLMGQLGLGPAPQARTIVLVDWGPRDAGCLHGSYPGKTPPSSNRTHVADADDISEKGIAVSAISAYQEPAGTTDQVIHRSLVSDALWDRLVGRIIKDEQMPRELAERIMDQALGFLRLCGETSGPESFSPSPLVDIGWHTFILYTRPYADFCYRVAGRFIHHNPSDEEGIDYGKGNISRTVAAMKGCGIAVDDALWANTGQDCSDYCSGGNCDNHA